MPPLEAKKVLFATRACHPWVMRDGRLQRPKLMFIEPEEYAYLKMPSEPPGRCRRLRRWLHGVRHAASAWEEDFSNTLKECGLVAGESSPVVFCNLQGDVRCVVHRDDFTFLAFEDQLRQIEETLRKHYSLVVRGVLGPESGDLRKISVLGRQLVWTEGGIVHEADPEHARKVIHGLGLTPSSCGLDKPCLRETLGEIEQDANELESADVTQFRSIAARVNYLSADRQDLQFAAKELCRMMARRTAGCWAKLKRLARYLVHFPRLTLRFKDTRILPTELWVYSDSDWAGCLRTRRSTSGGCVTLGGTATKTWSTMQPTIALSSGESGT